MIIYKTRLIRKDGEGTSVKIREDNETMGQAHPNQQTRRKEPGKQARGQGSMCLNLKPFSECSGSDHGT